MQRNTEIVLKPLPVFASSRNRLLLGVIAGVTVAALVVLGVTIGNSVKANLQAAPPVEDDASPRFTDSGARHFHPPFRVQIDGRYGFINVQGDLVVPAKFHYADPGFRDGLCMVQSPEGYGYADLTGSMVIAPSQGRRHSFSEGVASVSGPDEKYYGYIDVDGSQVIEPQFDTAGEFVNGFAVVGHETLWSKIRGRFADVGLIVDEHYIDHLGRRADPAVAAKFRRDHDTFGRSIWVEGGASFDLGDLYEREKLPVFEWTRSFSEGMAAVRIDGKWGFVDHGLNLVIPPQFSDAFYFRSGMAEVSKDGKCLYIDRAGRTVWAPE